MLQSRYLYSVGEWSKRKVEEQKLLSKRKESTGLRNQAEETEELNSRTFLSNKGMKNKGSLGRDNL